MKRKQEEQMSECDWMKINGILLVGFVLLISLLFVIGYLPLIQTQRIISPLTTETTESLSATYEIITYSDEPNKIIYYEESMNNAIARYVYTGNEKWLEKYNSLYIEIQYFFR